MDIENFKLVSETVSSKIQEYKSQMLEMIRTHMRELDKGKLYFDCVRHSSVKNYDFYFNDSYWNLDEIIFDNHTNSLTFVFITPDSEYNSRWFLFDCDLTIIQLCQILNLIYEYLNEDKIENNDKQFEIICTSATTDDCKKR